MNELKIVRSVLNHFKNDSVVGDVVVVGDFEISNVQIEDHNLLYLKRNGVITDNWVFCLAKWNKFKVSY